MIYHQSVLLKEVIEFLRIERGARYIDATLGGGGHTLEILKRGGKVLGIDCDEEAIGFVKNTWEKDSKTLEIDFKNLVIVKDNFRNIGNIAHLKGFEEVLGIVFDLGLSGRQIENGDRGFSFQREGPLDMRMDTSLSVKASDLLKVLTKKELTQLFIKLGEERKALLIARAIVNARITRSIETTGDLIRIIEEAYGFKGGVVSAKVRASLSKRVFQALRIAVNDELNNLSEALPSALRILKKNGRLAVITFHSLEDRIVKENFNNFESEKMAKILTKKPIEPSEDEIELNRRSRSAKLRIIEKL